MPRFLLLAYDDSTAHFHDMSPAEMEAVIGRYVAWSDRMRAEGRLHAGEKLADGTGRVVRPNGGELAVSDGPFAEAKEVLGGFWVLEADSFEHALELSRDCPHLEHGTLAIREIEVM